MPLNPLILMLNAQNQSVDAVQGPTNQAQGPEVQLQVQGPVNNNAQVG